MNFESIQQNNNPEKIDQDVYEKYKSISIDTATLRKPNQELVDEQKKAFLSQEIESPHFVYENIDLEKIDIANQGLLDLKKELKNSPNNKEISQAYIWKINEKLARIRMFKELQLMQDDPSGDHVNRYKRYIEFIYGKPEKDIFFDILKVIQRKINILDIQNFSEEQKDSFSYISNLVSVGLESEVETKDFDILRPNDPKECGEVVKDIDVIKKYFEEALENIGVQDEWSVVESKTARSSMAVQPKSKKVILPNQEQLSLRSQDRQFTPEMIQGLIAHEINTHVLRKVRAEKGRFNLLEIGLDRFEEGEEGLATYREHQETGVVDFAGLENYFTAGLAYGLDGEQQRDFTGVFEVLKHYYTVFDKPENAEDLAWKRCMRLFKGTPGNVKGLVFLKDIIYRKGNIATYELMKKDYSEKIDLDIGKYNPTNQRHISLLIKLGILDSDLENLDNV